MWGCFLMSGVKILHFLKDWWTSIPIHQNYTMALSEFIIVQKGILRQKSVTFGLIKPEPNQLIYTSQWGSPCNSRIIINYAPYCILWIATPFLDYA